jgi:hypothetical protein
MKLIDCLKIAEIRIYRHQIMKFHSSDVADYKIKRNR